MKYYVTSDLHGYFTEFIESLTNSGYFEEKEPCKLIICGDILNRGTEAIKMVNFVCDLMDKDKVILIRGNHEDYALRLINGWKDKIYLDKYYIIRGAIDTVCQLAECTMEYLVDHPEEVIEKFKNSPYITKIIPSMIRYYETDHYIFTHGWIPCNVKKITEYNKIYTPVEDWRNASDELFDESRFSNGMEAIHQGVRDSEKTIVSGHWHCSYGHSHFENDGGEFDNKPNFSPYYADGIIAIDACTVDSGKVNVITIED